MTELLILLAALPMLVALLWPSHQGEDHEPEWVDDPVSLPSCRVCGRAA
jgi:hypothetical protein